MLGLQVAEWISYGWLISTWNLGFYIKSIAFLFQFDSSLFFIMQILLNVWYVYVNKQWTVNIHLIFYRLLQQTILTSVHNSKLQWIDYPFFNDYSKENINCYLVALILYSLRILILNSFFSTRFIHHISNKNSRQYLIHFNTYSKKPAPICGTNWLCVDSSRFISPIWSTVLIHYLSAFPIDEYDCLLRTVGHQ